MNRCGRCVNVCTGMVLKMLDGMPVMLPFEKFGWSGCWRCQHCIAVCFKPRFELRAVTTEISREI